MLKSSQWLDIRLNAMCIYLAELGVDAVRHDLVLAGDIAHLDIECVDMKMVCRYFKYTAHLLQHPRHHLRLGGCLLVLAAGPRAVPGH